MPTPVSNARACLAAEAAAALDDAVGVARRRAHTQTTSLHVVYALIISSASGGRGGGGGGSSATRSILRDALSRARSSACSARSQFRALELCFGVALDRLPSSNRQAAEGSDDPPVSNSLMAAIKRSQANQRRNPDTFHLYQQQQTAAAAGGTTSFSGVRVELQQLVLAILDDPVVSRVFGDAGFRSMDIKLAILRPPPPILHFPRAARCPPLFLCNFSSGDGFETALTSKGLFFPFSTAAVGELYSDGGEENCRRIGEILERKKSCRNPMLVGVGAGEAAGEFARAVEQKNRAVLPPELRGVEFISIEKEVAELGSLEICTLMEELEKKAESSGVVLNIGDLNRLVEGSVKCDEQESCLVSELTRLLEVYHGRLWLMGWSATYETYMKFLSKHPMLDKDWDLQLLPITSLNTSLGGCMPRSPSLMESFVPFGGFFPTTCESKSLFSNAYQSMFRYEHCNDKYKQEAAVHIKDHSASVGGQENANLPFWLRKADVVSSHDEHDGAKAKDDKPLSGVKSLDLQRNWNDNCQCTHSDCQRTNKEDCGVLLCSASIPNTKKVCAQNTEIPADAETERGIDSYPISACTQNTSMGSKSMSMPSRVELGNKDSSRLQIGLSEIEQLQRENFLSHQVDGHASPSSVTSVITDLVLGTPHEPIYNKEGPDLQLQKDHSKEFSASWSPKKLHTVKGNPGLQMQELHVEEFSSSLATMKVDIVQGNAPDVPVETFSCSDHQDPKSKGTPLAVTPSFSHISSGCASMDGKPSIASPATGHTIDIGNYKSFCTRLMNKLGRQEAAVSAVSQAIIQCKTGERRRGGILRGDIWLIFGGPDTIGKKRMALALAELIYGSKENFVCIDLSNQYIFPCPRTICSRQNVDGTGVHFRGKMSVDHIAQELSRKPLSVIFLENVERADLLVQNSLCQARRTGKFPDSHGRQFSVNNSIFVLASTTRGQTFSERKDYSIFSEETILDARCWQMKITLQPAPESICIPKSNVSLATTPKPRNDQLYLYSPTIFLSKRKLDMSDGCENGTLQSAKRAHKTAKMLLDLNVPVEELEAHDSNSAGHEELPNFEISKAWMEDLYNRVDQAVDFEPFDFDALAEIMLQNVSKTFHSTVGRDCLLEIDPKAMEELLAAAWLLETRGALDHWFDKVLGKSFTEARCRYKLSNNSILKLACDDVVTEKHAPGVLLPSTVIVD